MGSPQNCYNRHLIISFLFLLLSSSSLMHFIAQGTPITKLLEAAIQVEKRQKQGWEKKMTIRTQVIGSTPPRCERRCGSCGHCEAVQVPVTTRILSHKKAIFSSIAYSRGDDISNYKPMSWKCKCGNLIFNP